MCMCVHYTVACMNTYRYTRHAADNSSKAPPSYNGTLPTFYSETLHHPTVGHTPPSHSGTHSTILQWDTLHHPTVEHTPPFYSGTHSTIPQWNTLRHSTVEHTRTLSSLPWPLHLTVGLAFVVSFATGPPAAPPVPESSCVHSQ